MADSNNKESSVTKVPMIYVCGECHRENEIKPRDPIRCRECDEKRTFLILNDYNQYHAPREADSASDFFTYTSKHDASVGSHQFLIKAVDDITPDEPAYSCRTVDLMYPDAIYLPRWKRQDY
uniref:SFRICE_000073 n=1 Tax=Spodoptera frugiperda TaxID=7108 RepID=A0A2H1X2W4_SPOFR